MSQQKRYEYVEMLSNDKFLELAVRGGAVYLISGVRDLRSLTPFRETTIVTAAEFLAATSEEEEV